MDGIHVRYNLLIALFLLICGAFILAVGLLLATPLRIGLGVLSSLIGIGFLTQPWFVVFPDRIELRNLLGMTMKTHPFALAGLEVREGIASPTGAIRRTGQVKGWPPGPVTLDETMNIWTKLRFSALASLVVALLVVTASSHRASADTQANADRIAARVQGFYDSTRTYQAHFEQVYHIEAYNRKKRSTGHVTFQRPGKMAWKYDQPNGNRVLSDGQLLRVYEKDKSQVVEQPLHTSQYPAVLSFLVGKGDLRKMFHLRRLDEKRMKFEGGYVLEGRPKKETSAYSRVIMYIDAQTAQVRRMLVIDAQRNRNMFTFSNPRVNDQLPPSVFEFEPPKGTQVVRR